MTRNGQAFALATSVPRTAASGSSSWPACPAPQAACSLLPTPVAGNFNDTESLASWRARRARQKALGRNGNGIGTPLSVAVRLLPTPTAGDRAGADGASPPGGVRPSGAKKQIHLQSVVAHQLTPPGTASSGRLLPTPTAVLSWRTAEEHLAWRHANGRALPCDLQAAVTLLPGGQPARPAPGANGAAGQKMLPTPDTGSSPRGHGRRGGRPGNGRQSGQNLDAVAATLPPAAGAGAPGLPAGTGQQAGTGTSGGHRPQAGSPAVGWGPYEAAIRRWEQVLGQPPPAPCEPGPHQRVRLSAAFTEWLMGIPGRVTGVPGIPRTAQLRIIGNGVVPHQAAAALRLLIGAAAVPGAPPGAGTTMRAAA